MTLSVRDRVIEAEAQNRHDSVESVLGTHAMEGLTPDAQAMALLRSYERGELSLDQFSAAMDSHARGLIASQHTIVGAA